MGVSAEATLVIPRPGWLMAERAEVICTDVYEISGVSLISGGGSTTKISTFYCDDSESSLRLSLTFQLHGVYA